MIGPSGISPSGGETKRGGAFPSAVGRLYGFYKYKANESQCLILVKMFLYRLVFRKPYNQPTAKGNAHFERSEDGLL